MSDAAPNPSNGLEPQSEQNPQDCREYFTPQAFAALLEELINAGFDCGAWNDEKATSYDELLRVYRRAKQAVLDAYLECFTVAST